MHIYVSGSVAYDRIMTFPGRFADHIMPDKIHMLNISFMVSGLVEHLGGTAGNIAYALALLGEQPLILASIGRDYHRYFEWLDLHHITREGIRTVEEEFTAGAYITTDQDNNQITGFNPGAMKHPCGYDLKAIDPGNSIGIIAAGNLEDMAGMQRAFVDSGTPFIFDPAQSLPIWDAKDLAACISGASILIGNDYELELIMMRTGLTQRQLLDRTRTIITTKGENGSTITTAGGDVQVPAYDCGSTAVDPTGAGDAYRGGVIKGLVEGRDIVTSARMGSVCASFAVQVQGTQEYRFTMDEFYQRLSSL